MIKKLLVYLFNSTESWAKHDSVESDLELGTEIAYLVHAIKTKQQTSLYPDSRLLKLLKDWKHWDKIERYVQL